MSDHAEPPMRQRSVSNLFTHPAGAIKAGGVLIGPSILSADFGRIADECRAVMDAGADFLHLDVMDGHFVPNLTMGPDMCRAVRRHLPDAFIDVHLMVNDPQRFVEPFIDAGANNLTFHVEAPAITLLAQPLAEEIHVRGASVGLAINPPTPVESIIRLLEHMDLILIMSVNPGYSGQKFIASVLSKTEQIARRLRPDQRLEMDGGIGPEEAVRCISAGCKAIAAASSIFKHPPAQYAEAIAGLRGS